MKNIKFLLSGLAMWLLSFGFVACSDSNSDVDQAPTGPMPEVTLADKGASDMSLSFMLSPKNAEQAAWLCVEPNQTVTADQVLDEGEQVDAKKAAVYMASGLQPETTYVIYAAVKNQHGTKLSNPLEMTTLEEIPVPTVTLTKVNQEYEKLTFTLTSTNAETVKWMQVSAEAGVTISRLLEMGTEVEANKEVTLESNARGMADMELAIYAVAVLGDQQVLSEPLTWTPEAKPALEADYEMEAEAVVSTYTKGSQLDNYLFTFTNEAGQTLVLDLDVQAGDYDLGTYYEVAEARKADRIYSAGSSFLATADATPLKIVSGDMEMVAMTEDDFVVEGEFILEDGKGVSFSFEGAMGLPERPQYYTVEVESGSIEAGTEANEWVLTLKNSVNGMITTLYLHNPRGNQGTDYLPAATYFVCTKALSTSDDPKGSYGWVDAAKSTIEFVGKTYKLLADKWKSISFESEMGNVDGKKDSNKFSCTDLPSEDEMAFFTMSYKGGLYGLGDAAQTKLPVDGHTQILDLVQDGNNFYIHLHRPQATDMHLYIQTTDGYLAGDPTSESYLFGRTYRIGAEENSLSTDSYYLEPAVGNETSDSRFYFTEGGITILPEFVKDEDGKDTEEVDPYSYRFSIDQTGLVGMLAEPLTQCTFYANQGGWKAAFMPKVSVDQLGVEGRTLKFSITSETCEKVTYWVLYKDEEGYMKPIEEEHKLYYEGNSSDPRPLLQYGTSVEVNKTVELTYTVPGPGQYSVYAAGQIGQQVTFPTAQDYNPIFLEVTE